MNITFEWSSARFAELIVLLQLSMNFSMNNYIKLSVKNVHFGFVVVDIEQTNKQKFRTKQISDRTEAEPRKNQRTKTVTRKNKRSETL